MFFSLYQKTHNGITPGAQHDKSFDFISLHRRRQPVSFSTVSRTFHILPPLFTTFNNNGIRVSFLREGETTHTSHTRLGLHTIMGFTELGHASRDGQWIYSWILPRTAFFYFGTGEAYYSTPRCTATCFFPNGAEGKSTLCLRAEEQYCHTNLLYRERDYTR